MMTVSNSEENRLIMENITDIYYRAVLSKEIHHGSSQKLTAYMKLFGYFNIFLSAIGTAGILILIEKPSFFMSNKIAIQAVILFVSFMNTLLASLILYRKDGEAAHEHKTTGDLYMEVRDRIISIYNKYLIQKYQNEDIFSDLYAIRKELNLLARTSIQTSRASYIKSKKRQPDKAAILNSLKNGTFPIVMNEGKRFEDIPSKNA